MGPEARRRRIAAAAALSAVVLSPGRAWAGPSAEQVRAARDLFVAAEHDEDAGRWSDALDKMQQVAAVRLTAGVRYHQALCEEHLGHLVAALADFEAARSQAKADHADDVLQLVGKHLDALTPRVPRLTVRVAPAGLDATVTLDDSVVAPSLLGVPMPVDPGEHKLVGSAPGRLQARSTVSMREQDVASVELTLAEAPPAAASANAATPVAPPAGAPTHAVQPAATAAGSIDAGAASTTTADAGSPPSHLPAWLATGGAVALAAGGIAAYLIADGAVSSGTQQCATEHAPCDGERKTIRAWDFTAAGAWIGAAALGVTAVVLWTRPHDAAPAASLFVGPGSAGVAGSF